MESTQSEFGRHAGLYLDRINQMLMRILAEEATSMARAAQRMADQIAEDRLIYVYGPGGHSNIAAQEVFFRAGGLAYLSAILDEGTLLSQGALRSVAMERTPGYGRTVIASHNLAADDLLLLVSAYGVNSALIDAAAEAANRGVFLIGLNSHEHALNTAPDHPARHSSKKNLQDVVDIAIDTKVPSGDALIELPGVNQPVGPASTFANIFSLNSLMIETVHILARRGLTPPIWRSINAPGGDEANKALVARLQSRIRLL